MKKYQLSAGRDFFLLAGILYSMAFLISCLTPCISPERFFPATYAALLFPYLLAGFLLWLLWVLFFYRRYFWLFALLLIPAWKNLHAVFSFHTPARFSYQKKAKQLRILSWNVNGFIYAEFRRHDFTEKQQAMMQFIKTTDADILCFQDYTESAPDFGKANIAYFRDSLGYPYHYFSNDCDNSGTIIFSRLPVLSGGRIPYSKKIYPESLAYADIRFQKDTIRMYNTHLHSMYLHSGVLNPKNVGYLEFVKEDTAFLFHSNRLQRLEYFDRLHVQQAKLVKEQLTKTNTRYIFCADLNTVPSGYVYHYIRQGLNDAFLQAGNGFGGTYHRFSLTLRIDVVFLSPGLKATRYFSPQLELSDHYPIVTDIEIKN